MLDRDVQDPKSKIQSQDEVLVQIEARIREVSAEAPTPVGDVALHLVTAGGKRVRPRVVIHAAEVGGHIANDLIDIATAAELVHNASLLHDDVIDDAPFRRGRPTARTVWGNAHSVLAGDHLMAAALELLEACRIPSVLRSMLATMRRLVRAEVIQLAHRGRLLPDHDLYDQVIRGKTAALFSWCADAGARAGSADKDVCSALATYGEELGVAYQLCDDLLDLAGTPEELGKSLFTDIAQGVATLPIVLAAQRQPALKKTLIAYTKRAPERHKASSLESLVATVKEAVVETGAATETLILARGHIDRAHDALDPLGDRPERRILDDLAESMLDRRS